MENKSFIDRAIEWISPVAGARRAYARYAIDLAYQAAKMRRVGSGSTVSAAGPNAEILPDIERLRARTRDQVRNTGFAKNSKRQWGTRLWSTGMVPIWDSSETRNDKLAKMWRKWSKTCWGNGTGNDGSTWELAGLTAIGSAFESGECLFLRRLHKSAEKRPLHMTFDILEADYLDRDRDGQRLQDGGYILGGIEFDAKGKRRAYYIKENHPGEWLIRSFNNQARRVLAEDIIHFYEPDRPGALRGVPHGAAVAERADDLAEYLRSDLMQKKVAACFAAFVTRPDADALPIAPEDGRTASGQRKEKIDPAMIHYLANGERVDVAAPAQAGGVRDTALVMAREIAAGYHMPYEIITGDWSETNYSSSRSGLIGFSDFVQQYRWLVLRPVLDGLVKWFLTAAYAANEIDKDHTDIEWSWTEPEFRLLDRLNEAQADEIELNLGTLTWPQAVRAKGYDPTEQAEEIRQFEDVRRAASVTERVQSDQNGQGKGTSNPPSTGNAGSQRGGRQNR